MKKDYRNFIRNFPNRESIEFFFELLNELIQELKLKNEDKRLNFNFRTDDYSINISINSRLVFRINKKSEFTLMLNASDIETLDSRINFRAGSENFALQQPIANLIYLDFQDLKNNITTLKPLWLKSCEEYLPTQTISQYRNYHIDDLFEITIDKEARNKIYSETFDPITDLIEQYKQIIKSKGLVEEIYKWKLVQKYKGRPDTNADDFGKEMKEIDISNLAYQMTKAVINHISDSNPEAYRQSFIQLFNEYIPLNERIKTFSNTIKQIYREMGETLSPHHNEREIATFLTYHNPEKYTFFMPTLYSQYCKLLGIKTKNTNDKYTHFLELMDDLIEKYILKDDDLMWKVDTELSKGNYYSDKKRKILAQDILYQTLKMNNEKLSKKAIVANVPKQSQFTPMPNIPLNQILYGPPGTGKTYHTVNKAIEIINPDFNLNQERNIVKQEFEKLKNEGKIVFITFHQSMTYEDFVEGIKPQKPTEEDHFLKYDVEAGIFKKLCISAQTPNQQDFNTAYNLFIADLENEEKISLKTPTGKSFSVALNSNNNLSLYTGETVNWNGSLTKENLQTYVKDKNEIKYWRGYYAGVANYLKEKYQYTEKDKKLKPNFVLIIDEINRGNISQIFGELITLLEDDKRLGNSESLEVTLPYSKEKFGIPSNLYIIGTMNTADRSVEALDTALRRRFSFTEVNSKPEIIATEGKLKDQNGIINGIDLVQLLKTINARVEVLLNRDHQIGHSYLLQVSNLSDLKSVFHNKIIPLLQEYFFGDFGKIGLTLGNGFASSNTNESNIDFFARFSTIYSGEEYLERPVYEIENVNDMDDEQFISAIYKLMNIESE